MKPVRPFKPVYFRLKPAAKPADPPLSFAIWKPGSYKRGTVAFHGGAYFIALTDTAHQPPSHDWRELKARSAPFSVPKSKDPKPRFPVLAGLFKGV